MLSELADTFRNTDRRLRETGIYTRVINILLLSYAFLLPFSSTYTVHTAPYLLLFFWILEGNFREKTKVMWKNGPSRYLLLFFLFSALSLLWTQNIHHGYSVVKLYFAHVIVFVIIVTSVEKKFLKYILGTFILAMFISEIASYGIMLGFWRLKGSPGDPTPFMNHIHYSIYLATTIILLLENILKKHGNLYLKFLETLFIITSTLNLFMNGGRTGQAAYIFAVIVFLFYYYHFKIRYLLLSIVIVLATLTTAYNVSPLFKSRMAIAKQDIEKVLYENDFQGSFGQRIGMKIIGYTAVTESPIFGFGIGDDMDTYRALATSEEMQKRIGIPVKQHTHDQYLQILLQTGIVGLLLFIMFIINLFDALKKNSTGEERLKQATLLAFVIVYLFAFFTDLGFKSHLGTLFIFMAAILYCRLSQQCGAMRTHDRKRLSKAADHSKI